MRLGHGQRRAVVILWAWTAVLSGLVLYPAYTGRGDGVVPLAVAALGFALYIFFHPGLRRWARGLGPGRRRLIVGPTWPSTAIVPDGADE